MSCFSADFVPVNLFSRFPPSTSNILKDISYVQWCLATAVLSGWADRINGNLLCEAHGCYKQASSHPTHMPLLCDTQSLVSEGQL